MAGSVFLGSVYGTLEMRTDQWQKDIKAAQADLDNLEKTSNTRLASLGQTFTNTGKKLSVGLTAPLVAFGVTSMNTANDIQVKWKEVEKVYGSTAGAFERDVGYLSGAVDELTLKFGQQKGTVLDALGAISAMGYEGKEAVDMLTQSLEFSVTGQMDLNEAMAGAVAISSIYNVKGDDLRKVLASLNTVENTTAASMKDLNEAVQVAGEAGKSAGVGIDELSAMMAVLRKRAIPAGEAADGLKTIFTRLRNATDDAKEIYDKYGISIYKTTPVIATSTSYTKEQTDEIKRLQSQLKSVTNSINDYSAGIKGVNLDEGERKKKLDELYTSQSRIKDQINALQAQGVQHTGVIQKQTGALKEADEILLDLAKVWPKLTDVEKEELAQSNAGLYQKNKFLSLMSDLTSENSIYTETLKGLGNAEQDVSTYTKEMNTFLDTNKTKIAQAKTAFNDLKIAIGGIISDEITPLLEKLGGLAKKFTELSPETQKFIVIIGMVAAVIGPLLIFIGMLITALTTIAGVVGLAVGPFLLIVAAIGLFVVLAIQAYKSIKKWIEEWKSLIKYFKDVAETGDWLNDWLTHLPKSIQGVVKTLGRIPEAVKGFFSFFKTGDLTPKFLKAIGMDEDAWFPTAMVTVRNFFTKLGDAISGFFGFFKTGDLTPKFLKAIGVDEDAWFPGAMVSIRNFFIKIGDAITGLFHFFKTGDLSGEFLRALGLAEDSPIATGLVNFRKFFINTWNGIVTFFKGVIDVFKSILDFFGSLFSWVWENMIEPILLLMFAVIARIFYEIYEAISTALTWIWTKMVEIWTAIWNFLSPYLEAFKNMILVVWNWISTTTQTVWNAIKDFMILLWKALVEEITKALDFFKSVIETAWNWIKDITEKIWNLIKEYIVNPFLNGCNIVKETATKIYNYLDEQFNKALNFVGNVWGKIKDAIVRPFEDAKNRVEEIAKKIRELAENISPFHKESPSLVEMVTRGVGEIKKQYMSLADISLPPIVQSMGMAGIATPAITGPTAGTTNTITNSPQFTVNVGVYAGSEMEKRALAKELSDAYNDYRKSTGDNL